MKENITLAFVLVCLGLFGLRGILSETSWLAAVGLFITAGLFACYSHLRYAKNKRKIGSLAMSNGWLSIAEIKQILYCQKDNGHKFGEIAVRRNYLTPDQVTSILETQHSMA